LPYDLPFARSEGKLRIVFTTRRAHTLPAGETVSVTRLPRCKPILSQCPTEDLTTRPPLTPLCSVFAELT
jgi:hypothetical protein